MVYRLGASWLKLYTPALELVRVMIWLVSVLVRVTVAFGTTAPAGSVTVPWMDALYCARAAGAHKATAPAAAIQIAPRPLFPLLRIPAPLRKRIARGLSGPHATVCLRVRKSRTER